MAQQVFLTIVAAIVATGARVPTASPSVPQSLPLLAPVPTPSPPSTPSPSPSPAGPTPTPTPTATPTPLRTPRALYFQALAGGGAYGLILAGDPVLVRATIDTNTPSQPFPLISGSVMANLEISIRDDRSRVVRPVLQNTPPGTPHIESQVGVAFAPTPISAWGYDLRKPGKYHIAFTFNSVTTGWAVGNGYGVKTDFSGDVRIVQAYADVNRHYFPPPNGWRHDRPDACLPHQADGRTSFPSLAVGKATPSGNECFLVYLYKDSIANGIAWEHQLATYAERTLLVEDDAVSCGHEHAATFSYESKTPPFTHTETVILTMSDGYIVARYERPAAAADDVGAEDALDGPCAVL